LVLVAVLGLPVAAVLAAWAVLHSERGTAWLLSGVPNLQVTAPQGALLGDTFSAQQLTWGWDQGRQGLQIDGLRWTGAQWRWWLRAGTWAGVQAERLEARRVVVNTGPVTGKPPVPPGSLVLPLEASIAQLRIEQLEVDRLPAWRRISGRLELGAQQGAAHRVDDLEFQWEELQARGQVSIATRPPLAVQARWAVQGTGAVAWEGDLSASGPLQALDLQARLQAPALASGARPALDATVQLKPFEPWPLGTLNLSLQALDLAQLSARLPATRLTGRAMVKSQGLTQPIQADILLDNATAGPWGDARLPVRRARLDVRSRPQAPGTLDIAHLDLDLGSAQRSAGLWRSSGSWAQASLRLQAEATEIKPHLLDARAPAMSLSGPLQLGVLGATASRPGSPPAWSVELRGKLTGTLETLGQRMTVALDGMVEPRGLQLRSLQAQAGAARADLTASVTPGAAGAWQLRSEGRISEFDPAPWVPGDAAAPWRKGPHRLNGQWSLDVALPPWRPGASPMPWLQRLRGSAQIEVASSRIAGVAASGRLRLEQSPESASALRSQLQADLRLGRNEFNLSGRGVGPRAGRVDPPVGAGAGWGRVVAADRPGAGAHHRLRPVARTGLPRRGEHRGLEKPGLCAGAGRGGLAVDGAGHRSPGVARGHAPSRARSEPAGAPARRGTRHPAPAQRQSGRGDAAAAARSPGPSAGHSRRRRHAGAPELRGRLDAPVGGWRALGGHGQAPGGRGLVRRSGRPRGIRAFSRLVSPGQGMAGRRRCAWRAALRRCLATAQPAPGQRPGGPGRGPAPEVGRGALRAS
jgi:translocation and assembly module TamB